MRETSLSAFTDLLEQGKISHGQSRVLWALMLRKDTPQTDLEITSLLQEHDPNKVRPRRRELVRLGLVKEAGKRECEVSKHTAIVWKVSDTIPDHFPDLKERHACAFCNGTGVLG